MKSRNENQCLREIIGGVNVRTWCVLSPLLRSLPLNIPLLILTQQNVCMKSSFLGLKLSGYLGLEWDWCLLLVWSGLCTSIFKAISQQGFYLSGAPLQGPVIQKMQCTNKSLRTFTWTGFIGGNAGKRAEFRAYLLRWTDESGIFIIFIIFIMGKTVY